MRNIIVFGHDPRMESVAGYFYHLGYDVYENPEEPVADACVITAPKLSDTSVTMPWIPKFNKNHRMIEATKIVVPAFVR